jgi:hypothetical protein
MIFPPKILTLIATCFVFISLKGQDLINIHEVESLNGLEEFTVFDHTEDHFLVGYNPSVISISGQSLNYSDTLVYVLSLLNSEFELIWTKSLSEVSSRVLDCKLSDDGVIVCGRASEDGQFFGGQSTDQLANYLSKFSFSGEMEWVYTGIHLVRGVDQFIEVNELGDVYLAGRLINNGTSMSFGGDELVSTGNDLQFPDNLCVLKFDSEGNELWGRVLQSELQGRPRRIKIHSDGNVYLAGFFGGQPVEFAGETIYEGEIVLNYSSEGIENWAYSIPEFENGWVQSGVDIWQMDLTDSSVVLNISSLSDSILLGDLVYQEQCSSFLQDEFLVSLNRNSGEFQNVLSLGCQFGGSSHQAIQATDEDILYLFLPEANQQLNGVDLGDSEHNAYVFGVDQDLEFNSTSLLFNFDVGDFRESRILRTDEKLFFVCKPDQEFSLNGNNIPEIMGSTYILEFDLTSQIEERFAPENEFIVYPNPSHSFIRFDGVPDSEIEFYEIYDGTGKLLITDLLNQTQEVDISQLAPGFYTMRIGSQIGRFIKQ